MSPVMLHQLTAHGRSGPAASRSGSLRSFNLELEHSQAASDAGSLCAESAPSEVALEQGNGESLDTAAVCCSPGGVGHRWGWPLCQSTQWPIHLLSQQDNGERLQLHSVQPPCSREWWMPAHWCCLNGVSTASRVCMASPMRMDVAILILALTVRYRVLLHACRDDISCNCWGTGAGPVANSRAQRCMGACSICGNSSRTTWHSFLEQHA